MARLGAENLAQQREMARMSAENLSMLDRLRSRVGAVATELHAAEVMLLDSTTVIPGNGSSGEVRVTDRGGWLQKMKGDPAWIIHPRGAAAGDVAPMRAHLKWQRKHGPNTLQFSVTISQGRACKPSFGVIHVPPQGWEGEFPVKLTALNFADLESAWCEKMGGGRRGGPAFSGMDKKTPTHLGPP